MNTVTLNDCFTSLLVIKHEYLRSRAYICLSLSSSSYLLKIYAFLSYQIMDYRDTRAYILDPCIQEFFNNKLVKQSLRVTVYKFTYLHLSAHSASLNTSFSQFTFAIIKANSAINLGLHMFLQSVLRKTITRR